MNVFARPSAEHSHDGAIEAYLMRRTIRTGVLDRVLKH
jgi:hypothetical protein